ncbi:MAG: 1-acyl-sn-glycerol-3-phosphate acyltransferase [Chthoniobacterales bacterium]|nr:1-acyl-sn-glycerol-3-phosphate acyltransferase [Chthoniobacterales bacterium]
MKESVQPPKISQFLLRFFHRYSTAYLRRHFHSVRLLRGNSPPNESGTPLVIYLNHSSWWDPLVCLLLAGKFFGQRQSYGPMEERALGRYGFFKRLGFFPVESGTPRGAAQFLRTSEAILARPETALFVTPQGRFADVRSPLLFSGGLEHLAERAPQILFVPLALEYTFWEERKPEVLLAFGKPRRSDLLARLAETQAQLSAAAQRRLPNEWQILLQGKSGVNWPYDLWRWSRARWRGERFEREHSRL